MGAKKGTTARRKEARVRSRSEMYLGAGQTENKQLREEAKAGKT